MRATLRSTLCCLFALVGCVAEKPVPAAPKSIGPDLNATVLEVLRSYPLNGTHKYYWPKPSESSWEGTTRDVVYAGKKLTSGDPAGRSYCCGLTFEVYVRALLQANGGQPLPGLTPDTLHELRLRFFGDSKQVRERRRLVQFGLESLELGRPIATLEEARAGDFIQFWRHSGSGHSAIFINWIHKQGKIVGLTYWSTQGSTDGIGYVTETIGGAKGVKRDEIYLARARWPLAR